MSESKQRSFSRETFDMAWPAVIESVLVALAGIVDTLMVSSLGKASVSAVGITNQPKFFVFTFFFAINTCISLMIARKVGEKNRRDANGLFVTGLFIVICMCALLTVICLLFAETFMSLAGANAETVGKSAQYFRVIMGGSIFNLLLLYVNAAQRGSGNTRLAMRTNIVSNIVNLVFDYLLINGKFGFPALGIIGAAIATVLGTACACVISVRTLFLEKSFVQVQYIVQEKIRPEIGYAKDMAGISTAILSENILSRLGMMITSSMTARVGTDPFAAHLVGMNFMTLGFAFADGLQAAAVALFGRSLGEGDIEKAKKYTWCSLQFGLIISAVFSGIMLLFNQQIYNIYYPNDAVMAGYGRMIAFYFAVILPIQISKTIFSAVLRGAGDVRYTMIGTTAGVTVIQPLCLYVFTNYFHMGLQGVWLSILISQGIQLILFAGRYFSNQWMKYVS